MTCYHEPFTLWPQLQTADYHFIWR